MVDSINLADPTVRAIEISAMVPSALFMAFLPNYRYWKLTIAATSTLS